MENDTIDILKSQIKAIEKYCDFRKCPFIKMSYENHDFNGFHKCLLFNEKLEENKVQDSPCGYYLIGYKRSKYCLDLFK